MPILKNQTKWEDLFYYRKSVVLYQMTVVFCRRFLPKFGDRTVDQMVQAARSGKQNIVEGLADGVTSTEMELKLLNVARASIKELKEDYLDYLVSHNLARWEAGHPRYDALLAYCRAHNDLPGQDADHYAGEEAEGLRGKRRHPRAHDSRPPRPSPDAERGDRGAQGPHHPP